MNAQSDVPSQVPPNPQASRLVALVTGANKGIGKAAVQRLADAGYTVYLACRDTVRGEAAAADLARADRDIRTIALDVTDTASIAAAATRLQAEIGHLDVLVNNAGINLAPLPPSQCEMQSLRDTYEVNVFGPVAVTRAMLSLLRAGKTRVIVNVSSELGSLGLHGYPDSPWEHVNIFAYNSSKTALNAFTVLLAKELREEGFKVNAVSPGYTATDLNQFSGHRTVEQASAVIAKYAMLDATGPTGGFYIDSGMVPW